MKQRPIIFNGAMVRAILDGRKTMTRRVIAKQPTTDLPVSTVAVEDRGIGFAEGRVITQYCPYGQPGDLLYVREAFRLIDFPPFQHDEFGECEIDFRATPESWLSSSGVPWKPSIHMLKKHARIWLWNSINEKRGHGWDANPWVWTISFKQVSAPTGGSDGNSGTR